MKEGDFALEEEVRCNYVTLMYLKISQTPKNHDRKY